MMSLGQAALVAAGHAAGDAAGDDQQKAAPLGLFVLLLLGVACYFLFKSMSRHLKRVRDDFPGGPATGSAPIRPTARRPMPTRPSATTPTAPATAAPGATDQPDRPAAPDLARDDRNPQ